MNEFTPKRPLADEPVPRSCTPSPKVLADASPLTDPGVLDAMRVARIGLDELKTRFIEAVGIEGADVAFAFAALERSVNILSRQRDDSNITLERILKSVTAQWRRSHLN